MGFNSVIDVEFNVWDGSAKAECCNVKALCCDSRLGSALLNLLGDEPWYAGWPSVPNHEYKYLERITDAVREALKTLEAGATQ